MRPIVKWAGGKRQLVPALLERFPDKYTAYYEPFVGGGALFFHIRANGFAGHAGINDSNERLVRTYKAVRDNVGGVANALQRHEKNFRAMGAVFYKAQRARHVDSLTDVEVAAWMIFLNKTCFNGLYRVNKDNVFNVPLGDYTNPVIVDLNVLRDAADALANTEVSAGDFTNAPVRNPRGAVFYFDPPYVPVSKTSNFASYTRDGFTMQDQIRLRDHALKLKDAGAFVLLTNAAVPEVEDLYGRDFKLERVQARRAINSKVEKRGPVGEYIIT